MWQPGAWSASPPQVDPPLAGLVCPQWLLLWGSPVHLACPEGTYDPDKSPLHTMQARSSASESVDAQNCAGIENSLLNRPRQPAPGSPYMEGIWVSFRYHIISVATAWQCDGKDSSLLQLAHRCLLSCRVETTRMYCYTMHLCSHGPPSTACSVML